MATPGGLVDKQELIDAQLDTAHLGRVVNSKDASGNPIDTSTNRTGGVNKTLDALEAEYLEAIQGAGGIPIGTWTAGVTTFNAYNEYAVYSGIPYKPRTSTALPYVAQGADPTAAPDDANVQPYQEITEAQVVAVVEATIPDELPKYSTLNFDSVADAVAVPNSKGVELSIGNVIGCDDYYGGLNPNGSGVLIFKVVAPGTGIDDGGKYITSSDGSFQLQQILRKPYNMLAWGVSPSISPTENDAAFLACISYAAQQEYVIIPNKIDQVKGNVYAPSGRYPFTAIDIPDGVLPEGDSPTSTIFIDAGTDTSRPFIQVGGTTREYNRCGLSKIGLLGAGVTDRNGIRFTRTYRMSGLFDCAIDGFYDNVVGDDFYAASFINNRVYSAVRDNFSIVNGTATYWERNRIEIAGRHNLYIDGSSALEPINLSLNGDKLQSAGGSAIHGVDVLSVELNSVFVESNNQLGGFNHVNFVGGGASNERGTILVSGGFITPGSGMTDSTALNIGNMQTVCLMPAFIRGGFDEGLRLGSSVDNAIIFGEIDGPATQTVIPDGVKYIRALRGGDIELNGFLTQKKIQRHRTIGSNSDSQSIDSLVYMDTSLNNVIYTIRSVDIEDGRTIDIQKRTGDSNRIVFRTEGSEPVNGDLVEVFFTEPYKRVTITCVDGEVFVG